MQSIGKTIKLNRTWKGLSSNELSKKANISASYLSKIEGDKVNPSISVIMDIANALEISLDELMNAGNSIPAEPDNPYIHPNLRATVVRSNQRKTMRPAGASVIYELLTPDLQRNIQFILVRHIPGEKVLTYSHIGEESILCMEGKAKVTVAEEVFILDPGDCISYDCSIPHSVTAIGDAPCVIISASTPPSF
jgi:transcriptional regulator with XRE-family HTH domain